MGRGGVRGQRRQIKVKDIEGSQLAPDKWLRKKVLLSDIDDSLVLDLLES
jgi:hypothetical protein